MSHTRVKAARPGLSVPLPTLRLMADNRLSVRDRELFLAEPHIAALSVSAGPGRGPLTVPIWYQYAPGGEAWVLTEAGSRKVQLIEAAGRFTLMVERVAPTVRYVSVEGPVTRTRFQGPMSCCGRSLRAICRRRRSRPTSSSPGRTLASRSRSTCVPSDGCRRILGLLTGHGRKRLAAASVRPIRESVGSFASGLRDR